MGIDIHMAIVKDKKYIAEDIFDGRNSEWFANLRGESWNEVYDHLPIKYGVKDQAPKSYIEKYSPDWCFDFRTIKVEDYIVWFRRYNPHLIAGWVSTYNEWRINKQGYCPGEDDLYQELPKDANPIDMHFIEVEKPYDCSKWLFDYIVNNKKISSDAYIIYCFDR